VRPSLAVTVAVLAVMAFVNGTRTMVAGALGVTFSAMFLCTVVIHLPAATVPSDRAIPQCA
jgi:hypothetical protein